MSEQVDILNKVLDDVRTDIINSMQAKGRLATGETAKALEIAVADGYGQLLAPFWIDALETGRQPTGANAVQGVPPMIDRIKAWCAAKGIDEKIAYAIKKSIDKKGYPGKPGVLTEPLSDDNLNRRLNPVLDHASTVLGKQVIDAFASIFE